MSRNNNVLPCSTEIPISWRRRERRGPVKTKAGRYCDCGETPLFRMGLEIGNTRNIKTYSNIPVLGWLVRSKRQKINWSAAPSLEGATRLRSVSCILYQMSPVPLLNTEYPVDHPQHWVRSTMLTASWPWVGIDKWLWGIKKCWNYYGLGWCLGSGPSQNSHGNQRVWNLFPRHQQPWKWVAKIIKICF